MHAILARNCDQFFRQCASYSVIVPLIGYCYRHLRTVAGGIECIARDSQRLGAFHIGEHGDQRKAAMLIDIGELLQQVFGRTLNIAEKAVPPRGR
ncbi:conserved hypothetical protein [Ricinus communis]|uniref:Uncharacterized protein n=1 Tax=Ricinus communis TaxID=3988 RepID=B9TE94_RICCO|nr:conserved hypothetical protein [Ricinus communis]